MTTPSIAVKQRLLLKGDAKVLQKSDTFIFFHQKNQIVVSEIIIIRPNIWSYQNILLYLQTFLNAELL